MKPAGISRNADFRNLWLSNTFSMFGAQVTAVAVPLVAALSLDATPLELGLLVAVQYVPYLFFGMIAGGLLDRLPKRPIMMTADIGRAVLLLIIPLGRYADVLSFPLLLAVALLVGSCTVLADIGGAAFLPALVPTKDLGEGNSKLELSNSAANVAGYGLGGLLVQVVTAPYAVVVNAATYTASALFLARIRPHDVPAQDDEEEQRNLFVGLAGIRAGLVVGAGGILFSALFILLSPVASIREIPTGSDDADSGPGHDDPRTDPESAATTDLTARAGADSPSDRWSRWRPRWSARPRRA